MCKVRESSIFFSRENKQSQQQPNRTPFSWNFPDSSTYSRHFLHFRLTSLIFFSHIQTTRIQMTSKNGSIVNYVSQTKISNNNTNTGSTRDTTIRLIEFVSYVQYIHKLQWIFFSTISTNWTADYTENTVCFSVSLANIIWK